MNIRTLPCQNWRTILCNRFFREEFPFCNTLSERKASGKNQTTYAKLSRIRCCNFDIHCRLPNELSPKQGA